MAFYSQEQIDQMRANVRRGLSKGKSTGNSRSSRWQPDYSLHDKLGLPRPPVMTKNEIDIAISLYPQGTQPNSPGRLVRIWDPYIEAEVARVVSLMQDAESDERVFSILGGSSATMKSTFRKWAEAVNDGSMSRDSLPGDAADVIDWIDGRKAAVLAF